VLAWLSVWSEVQMICVPSSWCHCHPIISCFTKIQIRLTFLIPAYPVCPGKEAAKCVSVIYLSVFFTCIELLGGWWWLSGSTLVLISKLTLHAAGLAPWWVTVLGRQTISVCNQPLRPTQPGRPSVHGHSEDWRWFWSLPLRWTEPCHPSVHGHSEDWQWFWLLLGKKWLVLWFTWPGLMAYCCGRLKALAVNLASHLAEVSCILASLGITTLAGS